MVTREGVQFQWRRITGNFKVLAKNKMALTGMSLLTFFVFAALAAPLLSSRGPNEVVSGRLAQPEWVLNFPDGYYLSKNLVVVQDPLFNSPTSIQQWIVTAPTSTLSNLDVSYAPGLSSTGASPGSIQLTYYSTS